MGEILGIHCNLLFDFLVLVGEVVIHQVSFWALGIELGFGSLRESDRRVRAIAGANEIRLCDGLLIHRHLLYFGGKLVSGRCLGKGLVEIFGTYAVRGGNPAGGCPYWLPMQPEL